VLYFVNIHIHIIISGTGITSAGIYKSRHASFMNMSWSCYRMYVHCYVNITGRTMTQLLEHWAIWGCCSCCCSCHVKQSHPLMICWCMRAIPPPRSCTKLTDDIMVTIWLVIAPLRFTVWVLSLALISREQPQP